jgi:hypothetical protein
MGKREEAWEVIKHLHMSPSDPSDDSARAEFTQIVRQVEHDKEEAAGFIAMFKRPTWRRRSLITLFLLYVTLSLSPREN